MVNREVIQDEALAHALPHHRSGLAVSMGVGKTLIGLKYLDFFYQQGLRRFVVAAPKIGIYDSWKKDAQDFNLMHVYAEITFITYLSLGKLTNVGFSILILDECHSLLESNLPFLSSFTGRILGLTGTPPRYNNSVKGQLVRTYCPIKYRYITDDAVQEQILNDYRIYVHMIPLSMKRNIEVKLKTGHSFWQSEMMAYEYCNKKIEEAKNPQDAKKATLLRMSMMKKWPSKEEYARKLLETNRNKVLVFANTKEQADKICAYSYYSGNPDSQRNLAWFAGDRIYHMACVDQLNEGITVTNLREGIVLHSYGNERRLAQRLGRFLRLGAGQMATIHVLCYQGTVDEQLWVPEALKDFDVSKITYVKLEKPQLCY